MKNNKLYSSFSTLIVVLALLFSIVVQAQPASSTANGNKIRTLLERLVPTWNTDVLKVDAPADWTKELSYKAVFATLKDQQKLPDNLPPNLQQLQLGESSVRLNPATGKIRYINTGRGWKLDSNARTKLIDYKLAQDIVLSAILELKLPSQEFEKPSVVTEMAKIGDLNTPVATDSFELYRIVTISRTINKLPVQESRVMGVVNHRAQIQRLLVNWSPFRLQPEMKIRSRKEVIDEAFGQIIAQSPTEQVSLQVRLVYTQKGSDDKDIWFIPAVAISIVTLETPYIVMVPIAK